MSESATNKALREHMPDRCMQRIESPRTGKGIADIWAGDAAIESKCLPSYPKGINTKVTLKHPLTIEQYRWLNARWRKGWKSYVVLQAKRVHWYLFAAPDAYVLVPGHEVPIGQLRAQALWYSDQGLSYTTFSRSDYEYGIANWLCRDMQNVNQDRLDNGLVSRWKDV